MTNVNRSAYHCNSVVHAGTTFMDNRPYRMNVERCDPETPGRRGEQEIQMTNEDRNRCHSSFVI